MLRMSFFSKLEITCLRFPFWLLETSGIRNAAIGQVGMAVRANFEGAETDVVPSAIGRYGIGLWESNGSLRRRVRNASVIECHGIQPLCGCMKRYNPERLLSGFF
jgi:hypothetical protein